MKASSHHRGRPTSNRRKRRLGLLRVRHWRVPTKLAAVLLIPAVAFLAIGGIYINTSVRAASTLDSFAEGVSVGRELTALVHELQAERDRTAGVTARVANNTLNDPVAIDTELRGSYTAVDAAVAAFTKAVQPLQGNALFRNTAAPLAEDFRQLGLIREGVKNRWVRREAVFDQYSMVISHLLGLVPARTEVGGDAAVAQNIISLLDLAEAKELVAQMRGRIFATCSAGRFEPADFESFAEVQARFVAAIQRFRQQASPRHLELYDRMIRGTEVSSVTRMQNLIMERSRGGAPGVSPNDWWYAVTTELDFLRAVERDLLADAIDSATDRAVGERRSAFVATFAIVVIMLAALLLSWLIGRSMARSLRSLRAQALDVAQHRLPEAIERLRTTPRTERVTFDVTSRVRTRDEIGEVADAFTAVHRSAVTLAAEQAVMRHNVNAMFVNLARRSQTLVERQLQLLDTLEAAETDPDQLGNLFKLDHLATRMRRNDENLLVLAGSEVGRRWREPVALTAVTIAAMAEIEQYARIRHDVNNSVYVVGHAVSDIVHLLAELLENATSFSPPESVVTVMGWLEQRTGEATITVEDHGIGMTDAGFAEANMRAARPLAIDVAASQRMGLVVVGHLAARHKVRVQLRGSAEGVVAYVTLPKDLLAPAPEGERDVGPYAATGRLTTVVRPSFIALREPEGRTATGSSALAFVDAPQTWPDGSPDSPPAAPGGPPADAPPISDAPVSGIPVSGVPISPVPISGIPVSGVPVSGVPVSGIPISGVPMSGDASTDVDPPDEIRRSAVPAASGHTEAAASAPPASAHPTSGPPAVPVSGAPAPETAPLAADPRVSAPAAGRNERSQLDRKRRAPKRAEDVLDPARAQAATGTRGAGNAGGSGDRAAGGPGNGQPGGGGTRWWSRGGGSAPAGRSASIPTQRPPAVPVVAGTSRAGLPMRAPMAQLPPDSEATQPPPPPHQEVEPEQVSSVLTSFYSGVHRAAVEDETATGPIAERHAVTDGGAPGGPEPTST